MKTWTYHQKHSFEYTDKTKIKVESQLYKTGIYVTINNEPKLQFTVTPKDMERSEKLLKEDEEKGVIKNLELKNPVTVKLGKDGYETV